MCAFRLRPVSRHDLRIGLFAGILGGLAEILWVGLYASGGSASAKAVAIEVSRTVIPGLTGSGSAFWLGLAIHMALAVAIGVLFVTALRALPSRVLSSSALFFGAVAFGAVIWSVNFLWVLPQLNPNFVALLPYGVTLISKLLFGAGLGFGLLVLRRTPLGMAPALKPLR